MSLTRYIKHQINKLFTVKDDVTKSAKLKEEISKLIKRLGNPSTIKQDDCKELLREWGNSNYDRLEDNKSQTLDFIYYKAFIIHYIAQRIINIKKDMKDVGINKNFSIEEINKCMKKCITDEWIFNKSSGRKINKIEMDGPILDEEIQYAVDKNFSRQGVLAYLQSKPPSEPILPPPLPKPEHISTFHRLPPPRRTSPLPDYPPPPPHHHSSSDPSSSSSSSSTPPSTTIYKKENKII